MPHITLLVHNIRSTHNVGAIFRTAEGFGVTEIVLSGYTPYPRLETGDPRLPHIAEKLTAQIHKTALGAEAMKTGAEAFAQRQGVAFRRANGAP